MGVLNVTPDSFSDGGRFFSVDRAVAHAEQMTAAGADIVDIGGQSTRPGSDFVSAEEESQRVLPVIELLAAKLALPISIDTTKAAVARAALQAGAEIVNDISGLRFDPTIADVAAETGAGLLLMHSRGTPKDMQQLPPIREIVPEVIKGLRETIGIANERGVRSDHIAIDPGIGFGKTVAQNLELIRNLGRIADEFPDLPLVIGTSRKSFLGKILDGAPADDRLHGTTASIVVAALNGAHIVRVHEVKPAVDALKFVDALRALS